MTANDLLIEILTNACTLDADIQIGIYNYDLDDYEYWPLEKEFINYDEKTITLIAN